MRCVASNAPATLTLTVQVLLMQYGTMTPEQAAALLQSELTQRKDSSINVVIFPENFMYEAYEAPDDPAHPHTAAISPIAAEHQVVVCLGTANVMIAEGKKVKRAVILGPDGSVLTYWDKKTVTDTQVALTRLHFCERTQLLLLCLHHSLPAVDAVATTCRTCSALPSSTSTALPAVQPPPALLPALLSVHMPQVWLPGAQRKSKKKADFQMVPGKGSSVVESKFGLIAGLICADIEQSDTHTAAIADSGASLVRGGSCIECLILRWLL